MRREVARGGASRWLRPPGGVSLCSARGNQRVYTTPHPCYLLTVQLVHTLISAGRTKRYAARTRWAEPPRRPAPRRLTPLCCSCLSSGGYFQWQWRLFPMAMPMPMPMAMALPLSSRRSLPSTTPTATTTVYDYVDYDLRLRLLRLRLSLGLGLRIVGSDTIRPTLRLRH